MTLGFIASFIPYIAGTSTSALVAALGMFLVCGGLVIPLLYRDRIAILLRRLLKVRFVVFALLVPVGPSLVAASSGKWNAVIYAFLMTITLAACQMTLGAITYHRLLRAFSKAGAVAILLFAVVNWHIVVHAAASGARLLPPHAQPNAIGFIFAGFAMALLWRSVDRGTHWIFRVGYSCVAAVAIALIFFAQSRASLLAVGCGAAFSIGVMGIRVIRRRKLATRGLLVIVMLVIIGIPSLLIVRPSYVNRVVAYTVKVLHLESHYRGIGTGLSGRIPRWETTVATVQSEGLWIFGAGYRTSSEELGFSVDNGYLTILYEAGLVGLLAVLLQLFWLFRSSASYYLRGYAGVDAVMLTVFALLTTFIVNNGFDRYLFGIGNPFSLLGLLFLLTDKEVLGRAQELVVNKPLGGPSRGRDLSRARLAVGLHRNLK